MTICVVLCGLAVGFAGYSGYLIYHRSQIENDHADLLVEWYKNTGIFGGGSSDYYVINTKKGSKTSVSSSEVASLGYNRKNYEDLLKIWSNKIGYSDSASNKYISSIAGQFDDNTIIFVVIDPNATGQAGHLHGSDMYSYDIDSGKYKFLMHNDDPNNHDVVAGHGKLFYHIEDYNRGKDVIYQYYLDSGKKVEVAAFDIKHNSPEQLVLDAVLK